MAVGDEVYRSAPNRTAGVVSEPAAGSTPASDVWLEVEVEAKGGTAQYSYYLVARQGVPAQANVARRSPQSY